jgi:hypothetical protein
MNQFRPGRRYETEERRVCEAAIIVRIYIVKSKGPQCAGAVFAVSMAFFCHSLPLRNERDWSYQCMAGMPYGKKAALTKVTFLGPIY